MVQIHASRRALYDRFATAAPGPREQHVGVDILAGPGGGLGAVNGIVGPQLWVSEALVCIERFAKDPTGLTCHTVAQQRVCQRAEHVDGEIWSDRRRIYQRDGLAVGDDRVMRLVASGVDQSVQPLPRWQHAPVLWHMRTPYVVRWPRCRLLEG